ncbi:chaplin [Streptomyces sp. NPDC007856]|uniref:chaplin n=1 Tax=Streptomyces sp. NPDC007856 TaxID=3364781 RepID=UPI00368F0FF0
MQKSAAVVAGAIMALGVAAPAFADAGASGYAANSPGVLSGNTVQVPVHIPVGVCGNSIGLVTLLNPASGSLCTNS